jgi:hypothetical protein
VEKEHHLNTGEIYFSKSLAVSGFCRRKGNYSSFCNDLAVKTGYNRYKGKKREQASLVHRKRGKDAIFNGKVKRGKSIQGPCPSLYSCS